MATISTKEKDEAEAGRAVATAAANRSRSVREARAVREAQAVARAGVAAGVGAGRVGCVSRQSHQGWQGLLFHW